MGSDANPLTPKPPLPQRGEGGQEPILKTFRASDGYVFYYRHWQPDGRPRGRVVFLHGVRSHGGWYGRSCGRLAEAGFEVFFLDRRGSGLNTARRGDCSGFRRLIDDMAEFVRGLRRERAWLPVTLGGISWGGKLAVALPYRWPGLVDRIALLCPGLCPQVRQPFATRARIFLARGLRPSKQFPIPLNEPELFTASPEWQRFIDTDRHGLRTATARFLFSSVGLDVYLRRAAKGMKVPSLLMLAGRDRIIDNAATRRFALGFPSRENCVIDYPGSHHTLEFESDGHPFIDDLVQWMGR